MATDRRKRFNEEAPEEAVTVKKATKEELERRRLQQEKETNENEGGST
jgi:hypothetical protein